MALSICIYCGSRSGEHALHSEAARTLGAALAIRGWTMIYGGGRIGLMGEVARGAMAAGGRVIGVIPLKLLEREQGMHEVNQLIVTETLRERKAIMFERADAFVTLPGGFGTLEEVIETLTLRQLAYHQKPILFLNIAGFYDPLLVFFNHAITAGFIPEAYRELYHVVNSVEECIALLAEMAES